MNADPPILKISFSCVTNATADTISFASAQSSLVCPKAPGFVPHVPTTTRNSNIQRSLDSSQKLCGESRKRRKRLGTLVMLKKKRKLLAFNQSEDPKRRLEQMASLATALMAMGIEFSNELTYVLGNN